MQKLNKVKDLSRFQKALGLVVVLMSLVVVLLVLLNLNVTFHVRELKLEGSLENAEIVGQRIELKFNRPLAQQSDWSEIVSVTPEVPFRTALQNSSLFIFFDNNLSSGTEYTISVDQSISDVYSESLREDYQTSFTTRSLEFYSLSSNKILKWDLETGEAQEIYSSEQEILDYDIADNYVATVEVVTDDISTLKLQNLNDATAKSLSDSDTESAYAVQFVPKRNQLFFLKEKIKYVEGYAVSDGGRGLFVYDLSSGATVQLEPDLGIEDIDEFEVAPDGRALLVRDSLNASYYLLDTNNLDSNIPLGRYIGTGGISPDNSQVLFSKLDPLGDEVNPYLVKVDSEKKETMVSSPGEYSIDPDYFNLTDSIAFSQVYKPVDGTRGLYEVILQSPDLENFTYFKVEGESLELPKVSPDDKFLVVENYTVEQLLDYSNLRVFGFQAKPKNAKLLVYNILEEELVLEIEGGVHAVWR